jgi:hypothetical protein
VRVRQEEASSIGWTLRRGKKRGRKASGRGTKRRGLGGRVSVVGEKNPVGPDLVESGKLPMEGGSRWRVRKKGGKNRNEVQHTRATCEPVAREWSCTTICVSQKRNIGEEREGVEKDAG